MVSVNEVVETKHLEANRGTTSPEVREIPPVRLAKLRTKRKEALCRRVANTFPHLVTNVCLNDGSERTLRARVIRLCVHEALAFPIEREVREVREDVV